MAFKRWQRASEAIELDLIPVMNLFMVLIPFLLMAATFFHIGVIPASLPSHVAADPPPEPPIEITLNVVVKAEQLEFTASSSEVDEETLAELATTIPIGEEIPSAEIQQYLLGLKGDYPTSDTAILLPHPELKVDRLVAILDAVREKDTGEKDSQGEPVFDPLFPVVIFSQFNAVLQGVEPGEVGAAEGAAPEGGEQP